MCLAHVDELLSKGTVPSRGKMQGVLQLAVHLGVRVLELLAGGSLVDWNILVLPHSALLVATLVELGKGGEAGKG